MRLKPVFLLLIFSFIHCFSIAQNPSEIDSLNTILKTAEDDTSKIRALNTLAYNFVFSQPDTALYFAQQASALALRLNDSSAIGFSYYNEGEANTSNENYGTALEKFNESLAVLKELLPHTKGEERADVLKYIYFDYTSIGNVNYLQGNYSVALQYFNVCLKIGEQMKSSSNIAIAYNNIAIIYTEQGYYPAALKNQLAALRIVEKTSNKVNISSSYNNIGGIYDAMGNYPEALKNHLIALKLRREINDEEGIADSYSNIGTAYVNLNKYDEALANNYASLKIWEQTDNLSGIATAYQNIGYVYKQQQKYAEALKSYFMSLKYWEQIEGSKDMAGVYTGIGNIYVIQKKYNDALVNLEKGLILSKEIGSIELIYNAYTGLATLDSATGNYKQGLKHYKLSINYRDSLYNTENTKKLVEAQMQYDFDKKEADAKAIQEKKDAVAEIDAKRQRIIRNSTFAGLAFVLLFAVVVYRQRNKIYREKKRSDQLVIDKEMLIKEIHHRVKNNLEVISSLLELQSAGMDDGKAKAAVAEGQSRVKSIALIHHKLYRNDDVASVEFKGFVNDLYKQVESVFKKPGTEVDFEIDAPETKINIDAAVPLGLILNELLTNTFKYAVKENKKNVISIQLTSQNNSGNYKLLFKDNGPGLPEDYRLENSTSLGMRVIQLLTKQVGGQLKFYNNNGSVFEIPFTSVV